MSASAPKTSQPSPAGLISGRYAWIRPLSRGGMGEVGEALDVFSGKRVALKRMLDGNRELGALFRSEYHALSRLKHPNIIEVYEYGVHDDTPYYTMELLDGEDLRETRPASLRDNARYLRDVASCLSLLHAQRLLHRDISPRNVRRTESGRCKLFDFGTMTPFGVPANIAGTRPFVAPEAWQGAALDQRADLYSLGALAYWLCTRTVPKSREPGEMSRLLRLIDVIPDVPVAFDELVMNLLELDPEQRPDSAAEVILALNAIFSLAPDEAPEVAQGYLQSTRFVGRRNEMAIVLAQLRRSLTSDGGSIHVCGAQGVGKSRLLAETRLLAQPHGFRVWMGHATLNAAPFSLTLELVCGLRRLAPETFDRLGSGERDAIERLTNSKLAALAQDRDQHGRIQSAVVAYVRALSKDAPWLLLVDDLHLADEASAAVLTACAHAASHRAVSIVATTSSEYTRSPARSFCAQASTLVTLADLDRRSTHALVTRLFGRAPHLHRVEDYLFREARGNPGLTIELAQALLQAQVIRYAQGSFVLPGDDFTARLPANGNHHVSLRLAHLSAGARTLFALACMHRDELSVELCLRMHRRAEDDALSALNELSAAGLLRGSRTRYVVAKEALRGAMLAELDDATRQTLHTRLANALSEDAGRDDASALEAAFHGLHTPAARAAAQRIAELGPGLIEEGLLYARAIEASELALVVLERAQDAYGLRLALRGALVRASYLYDERLAERYGPSTLDALDSWMNLGRITRRLSFLPPVVQLYVVWVVTALRHFFTRPRKRGPLPHEAFLAFGRTLLSMLGVSALKLDGPEADALARRLSFMRVAPTFTSGRAAYEAACALALPPRGREGDVAAAVQAAMQALDTNRAEDLRSTETRDLRVGLLTAAGVNDCNRAGSDALARAALLDSMGTGISRAAALRIRLTYHVVRGDRERAEHYRRKLDVHATEGGTTWQVEWFAVPVEGYAAASFGDVVGVERARVAVARIAETAPTLAFTVRLLELLHRMSRDDFDAAITLGEEFVASTPPRSVAGWALGYAALARAHNSMGDHTRARAVCEQALAHVSAADLAYEVRYGPLTGEHGVALAGLGELRAYRVIRDERRARLSAASEHALLVLAEESHVRAAQAAFDLEALVDALSRMREAASRSESKLVSDYALATTARHARARLRAQRSLAPVTGDADDVAEVTEYQRAPSATKQSVLRSLLDEAGARGACLLVAVPGGLKLGSSAGDLELTREHLATAVAIAERAIAQRGAPSQKHVAMLRAGLGELHAVLIGKPNDSALGALVLWRVAGAEPLTAHGLPLERLAGLLTRDLLDWESTDLELRS